MHKSNLLPGLAQQTVSEQLVDGLPWLGIIRGQRLFDQFRQASNARGHSSVGLGLYIVHNLVIAQGGRVWVDSELGKGTTFTVALPVRR